MFGEKETVLLPKNLINMVAKKPELACHLIAEMLQATLQDPDNITDFTVSKEEVYRKLYVYFRDHTANVIRPEDLN